jgi:hypothetical protein
MRNPSLSKEEKSEKQRLSACHRRHCRGAGARRQAGLKPWNAEHAARGITNLTESEKCLIQKVAGEVLGESVSS